MKQEKSVFRYISKEELSKIFGKVFEKHTIQAIHFLSNKKVFDTLEFVLSEGKEAVVFRANTFEKGFVAVKVYKISTSTFKHMQDYLIGDRRFQKIRKQKKDIVFAWTKKEYKNLKKLRNAGVIVPKPIAFKENILVMEFIGDKGEKAKTLKETKITDKKTLEKIYLELVKFIALSVKKAKLIHADLSEYNLLYLKDKPIVIDTGQAILTTHPKAKEFFERDIYNLSNYFSKHGLKKSFKEMYQDVKKFNENKSN